MKIRNIAKITGGQDGAIWNKLLFRFNTKGLCNVFDISDLKSEDKIVEPAPIATFTLDRADEICPHSNAVMFGNEYYSPEDEFPLLYSNIYNNYAKEEERREGVCLVYRLQRTANGFTTELVQMLKIGFTDNNEHWISSGTEDVRPYGNFTIDRERGILYAFNMRDESRTTRYFAFELPKVADGIIDEEYGVKMVTLNVCNIRDYFDCEYHLFVQGACCHKGKIYSSEGFSTTIGKPPVLRVINPQTKKQEYMINFAEHGMDTEAEFIDFCEDICYYSDAHGNFYIIEF